MLIELSYKYLKSYIEWLFASTLVSNHVSKITCREEDY